jgi:hypothetical protein
MSPIITTDQHTIVFDHKDVDTLYTGQMIDGKFDGIGRNDGEWGYKTISSQKGSLKLINFMGMEGLS